MGFVYVTENGANVKLNGGKIIIEKGRQNIAEIPKYTVDGILLLESVQITSQALTEFLKLGIPVTWISSNGKFYGRLESSEHVNVNRHVKQVQMQGSKFSLSMAKKVIASKIHNQQVLLRRYNRRRNLKDVEAAIRQIDKIVPYISSVATTESLLGYEGIAAKSYFSALGRLVPKEFSFSKRSKRPPQDAFNAMLSFGYSMLLSEIYTSVINENLHPYFGFMHKLKEHHPALASDLIEEWRPVLIDSLALSLVSHNEIKLNCFEPVKSSGIFLNSNGRKTFIHAYENKLQTLSENGCSYRHMLGVHAAKYAQALMAESERVYEPFRIR